MRKRILSMLAALSLAITLLPVTALAANDGKIDVQNSTFRGIQASAFSPALDEVQGTNWTTKGQNVSLSPARLADGNHGYSKTEIKVGTNEVADYNFYYIHEKDEIAKVRVPHSGETEARETFESAYKTHEQFANINLQDGDLVIIETIDNNDKSHYYLINVKEASADSSASLASEKVTIKGVDSQSLSGKAMDASEAANVATLDQTSKYVTLTQKLSGSMAADPARKNVFKGYYGWELVEARVVALVENDTEVNIVDAFDKGTPLTETGSLTRGEDGNAWVVVKVTAEDRTTSWYYIIKVEITNDDASIKSGEVSYDNSKYAIAESEGGTEATPAALSVTVPYADKDELDDVKVTLIVNEDVKEVAYRAEGNSNWKVATLSPASAKQKTKKAEIASADLANTKGLIVRVTAEDGTVKYYKLTANLNAASKKAVLIQAEVTDGASNRAKFENVKVDGNLNATGGTAQSPVELTGLIPYGANNTKNVEVVVKASDKATVTYYIDDHKPAGLTNKMIKDPALYPSNTKGMAGITVPDADATKYVYIKVTAEDGKTENVYLLTLKEAEIGTEAKITSVIVQNNTTTYQDAVVTNLDAEPSNDDRYPTELTVSLPAGTPTYALVARLTVTPGAKVKYSNFP